MTYFEVLVEGGSDVPTMREILVRRFNAQGQFQHFNIFTPIG